MLRTFLSPENPLFLIGDVHIGRKFTTGVPLNRRGDKEKLIKQTFENYVNTGISMVKDGSYRAVIQLGDLFDTFSVNYNDLMWTYATVMRFEEAGVHAYFLAGNHDLSKDTDRFSALSVLSYLCRGCQFIHFIINEPYLFQSTRGLGLIVPYSHTKTLSEQLEPFKDYPITDVYGHFDEPFDPSLSRFKWVHTGHIHCPGITGIDHTLIYKAGSIVPLTFGDALPDSEHMRTVTLAEYEQELADGLSHDRCYRIKLSSGESLPENPDCLQMIPYRENAISEEENISVEYETFDIEKMFHEALDDTGLFSELYQLYLNYKMTEAANV